MNIIKILVIGISLSMDALAVSICKGISLGRVKVNKCCHVGIYFGLFQALMPLIGYYVGDLFSSLFSSVSHWIIFSIFLIIGANMIFESTCLKNDEMNSYVDFQSMFMPAVATSIDALAIGVTFALMNINIWISILVIGVTTFTLTTLGTYIGSKVGERYSNKAKVLGGILLIFMGVKELINYFL